MNAVPLAGKVAVVTGASRGLGKRICEAFAEVGMAVAMLSRTEEALAAAVAEIGPAAAAFPTDIANPADVARAFSEIVRRLGAVDYLINNAALGHLQSIEEADDRLLQEEVGTNLLGAIYVPAERLQALLANLPLKRIGTTQDIVNACLFLLSDEASWVTGQTWCVDGGTVLKI